MTRFSLQRHLPSLASYNHERFSFFDFLDYVLHTHFPVLFIHQSLSKHCLLHLDGRSTYARLYPLPDVLPCLLHLVCPVVFFFFFPFHTTLYYSSLHSPDIYIYYVTFYSIPWLPINGMKVEMLVYEYLANLHIQLFNIKQYSCQSINYNRSLGLNFKWRKQEKINKL